MTWWAFVGATEFLRFLYSIWENELLDWISERRRLTISLVGFVQFRFQTAKSTEKTCIVKTFDSWFSYSDLVNENRLWLILYFEFRRRIISDWESKIEGTRSSFTHEYDFWFSRSCNCFFCQTTRSNVFICILIHNLLRVGSFFDSKNFQVLSSYVKKYGSNNATPTCDHQFFQFWFSLLSNHLFICFPARLKEKRFSGIISFNWTFLESFQFQKLNDQQLGAEVLRYSKCLAR